MGKPEIRFKGYTDEWEQRKLSELLYLSSERNDGSYTRDDVLAASLGTELQKKHIYFGLRATDESVKNYKVVLPNDVIYTKSPIKGFPNGIIRTSKGENGIVPTLYCVYHSIDVINPSIIQAYFESKERLDAYLIPLVNIGARNNVNITDKEFLEGAICIPKDKAEQDKIVDVLERLSNLITLHQRKCDEVKTLKKYMLQKMFPQNEQKVPEIRFEGFTEAWEQRKLGDIASSFEYGLNAAAKEYDGENKYIRITDIDDNTHKFLTDNLTSPDIDLTGADNYKLTEGDILFARTGASVGKTYIYRNSDGLVYYAGFLIRARIKEEYDAEFVFQNTLTDRYNKYIAVTSQRSGQPGVNAQEYAEFEINVPKKEEQTKIGTYFRNIDHLITLHQQKCEELKKLKKFMLQRMFV